MKRKYIFSAPCMPYFVSSSLSQSVDSHSLWGGLTDGLPSTLDSVRSRFERDRTSLRCPPYAAPNSVQVLKMTRRRDCLMTPHFLIWSFGPKIGSVHEICDQTDCVCVCVFSSHSFWTSRSLDVPAGVTQEEGHTGFLSTFFLRCVPSFFSREGFSLSFPSSTVKSNFVY